MASHQVHQIHQNHPESLESSESPRLIGIIRITESITKAEFVHFTWCTSVQYSPYCFCRPSFGPASADENIFNCAVHIGKEAQVQIAFLAKLKLMFRIRGMQRALVPYIDSVIVGNDQFLFLLREARHNLKRHNMADRVQG